MPTQIISENYKVMGYYEFIKDPKTELLLNKSITIRLRAKERALIKKIIAESEGVFVSESHFIRCAIIKELKGRYEQKKN